MSQAKVDRYKEEKRNRAKIMAKQKRENLMIKICGSVLAVAIIGWAGFSMYQTITRTPEENTATTETESYTVNLDALDEYINSLS